MAWAARLLGAVELTDLEARARAWAERCCVDQGLRFEIDDRQTVVRIVELLGIAAQTRKTARKRDSSSGAL